MASIAHRTTQKRAEITTTKPQLSTKEMEEPEAFYELVEKLCPAPRYAELFARRSRAKWDGHGDEVENAA